MEIERRPWLAWALAAYGVSTLVSMATMSIGVAVALVATVAALGGPARYWRAIRGAIAARGPRLYLILALGLTGACAASLLAAIVFPLSYDGKGPDISFLRDMAKCWYLFLPILLLPGITALDQSERRLVLRAWLIAFGVLSVVGVVQYFFGWPRPQAIPTLPGRFHATVFLGHHLSVASIFVFPFFFALDLLGRREESLLPKWTLGAIVAVGGLTLLLGYSRTLWFALPAGLVVWGILRLPKKYALGIGAFLFALGIGASFHPVVRDRFGDRYGLVTRVELWKANFEFFKARPLTGTGWHHNLELSGYYFHEKNPSQTDFFSGHAHNNFIEMLGGTGALGLGAWLAWCIFVAWISWPTSRGRASTYQAPLGILSAWVAFHVNGLTQVNFWESKVLHQMLWAITWCLLWRERERA